MQRKIKNIFLTGIAVVVPIGVTVYILFFIIGMMDNVLALLPVGMHPDRLLGFHIPGLGVMVTVLLVFIAGLIARSWFGHRIVGAWERLFNRIPLVRSIYQASKQIVDTLFSGGGTQFRKVVLMEFPRKGTYTVAFVTGEAKGVPGILTGRTYINVFVPTAPNPTSGYYLIVPEDEVISTTMTIEEAFKLVISGGLVVPEAKMER